MTTTREEFEAWVKSCGLDVKRHPISDTAWEAWQAAHLAGQRAMQERAAKLCDGLHYRWHFGDDDTDSGPSECAAGVRAMEVKP